MCSLFAYNLIEVTRLINMFPFVWDLKYNLIYLWTRYYCMRTSISRMKIPLAHTYTKNI